MGMDYTASARARSDRERAWGLAGLNNSGPHGFSEMLYAYTSATGNNGSAFAGLTANTPWYTPARETGEDPFRSPALYH